MAGMKGLKKVSGQTKNLKGAYDSIYLQLHYDTENKEVFTTEHCNFGHNSYSKFDDEKIINCGLICEPRTMREIEDQVHKALAIREFGM